MAKLEGGGLQERRWGLREGEWKTVCMRTCCLRWRECRPAYACMKVFRLTGHATGRRVEGLQGGQRGKGAGQRPAEVSVGANVEGNEVDQGGPGSKGRSKA